MARYPLHAHPARTDCSASPRPRSWPRRGRAAESSRRASVNSFERMPRISWRWSPSGKSVRPMLPAKITSPTNTTRRLLAFPQIDDVAGVWPGMAPHLPLEAGRLVGVAVVDDHVGRRADQRHAEAGRKVQPGIGQFGGVAGADHQRAIGPSLLHGRVARQCGRYGRAYSGWPPATSPCCSRWRMIFSGSRPGSTTTQSRAVPKPGNIGILLEGMGQNRGKLQIRLLHETGLLTGRKTG